MRTSAKKPSLRDFTFFAKGAMAVFSSPEESRSIWPRLRRKSTCASSSSRLAEIADGLLALIW